MQVTDVKTTKSMKLYYFTETYPYGMGLQWKTHELSSMTKYFDEVTLVPLHYGDNFDTPVAVPDGVTVLPPLFKKIHAPILKSDVLEFLTHKYAVQFFTEFFKKKLYSNKTLLIEWANTTRRIVKILAHPVVKDIINKVDEETVLYFFWGKGCCDILPLVKFKKAHNVAVRLHGFDLFEFRNNNYIPYRKQLLENVSDILHVSEAGEKYLVNKYPFSKSHSRVMRLGTRNNTGKVSVPSQDNVLRVVSCSRMIPLKRIHLMIEAVSYLNIPVLWKHIGSGELETQLHELRDKYNLGNKFVFEGLMSADSIVDYYVNNSFDVFVNASTTEGVPISIMEAFSAGIPVLATNVGGTSEIVDEQVGCLLKEDISAKDLADALNGFYQLEDLKKHQMRANAVERFKNMCDAEKLADDLAVYLSS